MLNNDMLRGFKHFSRLQYVGELLVFEIAFFLESSVSHVRGASQSARAVNLVKSHYPEDIARLVTKLMLLLLVSMKIEYKNIQ